MDKGSRATKALKVILCILLMYTFSISLTFYNKWIVKILHMPLSVSVIHYSLTFLLTAILRRIWEIRTHKKRVVLEWSVYIRRVCPTAIATALDISFSNWSLMFITVSLYTMCKSTAIIFILLFSLIFGLEKFHYVQVVIVFLVAGGLFMFTYESTQFNLTGFLLVMSAASLSGVRWATTQLLLQKQSWGLTSPFDTIYHLQPLMIMSILPLVIGIEGEKLAVSLHVFRAPSLQIIASTVSMVLFGASLAFMLTVSEYLLLGKTSSVTLAVAGIFKEVFTILIATEFGGDKMDLIKIAGLITCLLGIALHVLYKYMKDEPSNNADDKLEKVKMLQSDDRRSSESDVGEY